MANVMHWCADWNCRHAWYKSLDACPACGSTRWTTDWDEWQDHREAHDIAEEMAWDEEE